ncbi:uncharacterized protein LOC116247859 isoform X3 [Nymphaea colorata]|uniref:uncharacterized protein LOC116247859 isoform X3 n=1 Tax=Nymphaea colorata TaxID=210225 RepID=UPI00129D5A4E|nr:uncharacterized protein LOC116247859 isoform X3 [Nymphaea colorata]
MREIRRICPIFPPFLVVKLSPSIVILFLVGSQCGLFWEPIFSRGLLLGSHDDLRNEHCDDCTWLCVHHLCAHQVGLHEDSVQAAAAGRSAPKCRIEQTYMNWKKLLLQSFLRQISIVMISLLKNMPSARYAWRGSIKGGTS